MLTRVGGMGGCGGGVPRCRCRERASRKTINEVNAPCLLIVSLPGRLAAGPMLVRLMYAPPPHPSPPPPSTPPPTHTCPGRNEGTKDPSFLLAELLIQHQRRPQGAPGAQPRRQSRARGAAVVRRLLALATQPGGAPGGRPARAPRAPALVAVHRLRVLSASPGGCSGRGRPRGPRAHPVTPPCASRSPKNVLSSQVPRRIAVPRTVSADSAVPGASEPMYVVIYHLKE